MHGLIFRTLQMFLQDTYGDEIWTQVAHQADLEITDFEAMLSYSPRLFEDALTAACAVLERDRETILEDIGTYLVSHENNERLRRLLRFGGNDFIDFLHSLDDLPGRTRLAVPDLNLPELELYDTADNEFTLCVIGPIRGFCHVMAGVLRAMADDYGTLVLLELLGLQGDHEMIRMTLIDNEHSEGKAFHLAARGPGQRHAS